MATEVFHMDANGVRISARRAVFGEHAYAPRNIRNVERIEDKGVRWPGMSTLVVGFIALAAGLVLQHTVTLLIGAVAVTSGSFNLARKKPRYGIRITTQRGPVYVLASRDQRYVEVVADALLRAISVAHQSREAAREETEDGGRAQARAPESGAASSRWSSYAAERRSHRRRPVVAEVVLRRVGGGVSAARLRGTPPSGGASWT